MGCAADRVPVASTNKGSHFAGSTRLMAVGRCAVRSPAPHRLVQVQGVTERSATDKDGNGTGTRRTMDGFLVSCVALRWNRTDPAKDMSLCRRSVCPLVAVLT
jgi:hypothetical protein